MTRFAPGDKVRVVANVVCALSRYDGGDLTVKSNGIIPNGLVSITVKETDWICNNASHLALVEAAPVEEEYREIDSVICSINSAPHYATRCMTKNPTKLYVKVPTHEHTFALVCTGCGAGETE